MNLNKKIKQNTIIRFDIPDFGKCIQSSSSYVTEDAILTYIIFP